MTKVQEHDPELTEGIMRRGFPRPVFDIETIDWRELETVRRFLPAPYSGETHEISVISEVRASECIRDVVCSVCGEEVDFNEQGYITVLPKNNVLTYESGPFHPKCATLTMKFCPHIAQSNEWSVAMIPGWLWLKHRHYWVGDGYRSSFDPGLNIDTGEPGRSRL